MKQQFAWTFLLLGAVLLAVLSSRPLVASDTFPVTIDETEFGLAFVNSAEVDRRSSRIQRGVDAGATLDRFPFYWPRIETSEGEFDWRNQDRAVRDNEAQGLGTLAILLDTPNHYKPADDAALGTTLPPLGGSVLRRTGTRTRPMAEAGCGPPAPEGLFKPIFADDTDTPGSSKTINPANPWARFVDRAVERYKPGGTAGTNLRHWEIWNEPDLCQFWSGTVDEYARLLKVAYIVIHWRDPDATVLWAGLAHHEQSEFLSNLVELLKNDPMSAEFNGFFDAAASHHYVASWQGYHDTKRIRDALAGAGWDAKPIWITESGVPVCGDLTDSPSCPEDYHATRREQAAYVWQNVAYTRLAGGGPIFHFQLHDDCADTSPPNAPVPFGLAKNEPDSLCSPSDAELRPSYIAYQLAADHFAATEVLWADIQGEVDRRVRRVAFYHPETRERRVLVWAIDGNDAVVNVPATGDNGKLLALDGTVTEAIPMTDTYHLPMPAATNQAYPNSDIYTIGGEPALLIERDTFPPTATIASLAAVSPESFTVSWSASDNLGSGIATVDIWTRENEGVWALWREGQPASGQTVFTGTGGYHYQFAAVATDRAGNSQPGPSAQAETIVRVAVKYLPALFN